MGEYNDLIKQQLKDAKEQLGKKDKEIDVLKEAQELVVREDITIDAIKFLLTHTQKTGE